MSVVEVGAVRELWLARHDDPGTKWSFLEEPASGSVTGTQFGRTVRLGDPVNVGFASNWHMTSWVGGEQQTIWRDQEMYLSSTLDTNSAPGKLRMNPGLRSVIKWNDAGRDKFGSFIMAEGGQNNVHSTQTPLWVGASDAYVGNPVRGAAYHVWKVQPWIAHTSSASVRHVLTAAKPIRAILPLRSDNHAENWMMVLAEDRMYLINEDTLAVHTDPNAPLSGIPTGYTHGGAVTFGDAVFYLWRDRLNRRLPGSLGVNGNHSVIKEVTSASYLRGLAVWNNRLWFGAVYPSGAGSVFVSDGATVVKAFDFPTEFEPHWMVGHYGFLFIAGVTKGRQDETTVIQQIWRYDGRSLRKLWEETENHDGFNHWGGGLATLGKYVTWGRDGTTSNDGHACLMHYDPENDAIFKGAGFPKPGPSPALFVRGIATWNNTFVAAFMDRHTYTSAQGPAFAAFVRKYPFVRHDLRGHRNDYPAPLFTPPDVMAGEIITSEYFGPQDTQGENKTWLNVHIDAVSLAADPSNINISVWAGFDFDPTTGTPPTFLDTVGVPLMTPYGSRVRLTIPIEVDGTHPQSRSIVLRVRVTNNEPTNVDSTDRFEITAINVEWMLAPRTRRTWRVRVPLTDQQRRLDGSANPLATAQALGDQLQQLWSEQRPLLLWGPSSTPGVPSGPGTEVVITDYVRQESPVRTGTGTQTVGAAIVTLVENV